MEPSIFFNGIGPFLDFIFAEMVDVVFGHQAAGHLESMDHFGWDIYRDQKLRDLSFHVIHGHRPRLVGVFIEKDRVFRPRVPAELAAEPFFLVTENFDHLSGHGHATVPRTVCHADLLVSPAFSGMSGWCALRTRRTVAVEIWWSLAMRRKLKPRARSAMMAAVSKSSGRRPMCLPSKRARRRPAFTRSTIKLRSNSAMAATIVMMALPSGPEVSICSR